MSSSAEPRNLHRRRGYRRNPGRAGRLWAAALLIVATLGATACGGGSDAGVLTIYTSVTQDTVDAVVAGYQAGNPDVQVDVFRAPTGELTARIAAELRDDDLQADVLWLTDPLSMQQYARDGLLRSWTPENLDAISGDYRTDTFFGTRILNMVIVVPADGTTDVEDWPDLVEVEGIALPDPGFAGSAFGALAYFLTTPGYGTEFYAALARSDGVQVRSPGEVVTGVAEGVYGAGISLDRSIRSAVEDGSPVRLIWPRSGSIAIYSPIAVVDAPEVEQAESFVEYVLSVPAQTAIAGTGWEPIRPDVAWERVGPQLAIDWTAAFDRQEELLAEYRIAFDA